MNRRRLIQAVLGMPALAVAGLSGPVGMGRVEGLAMRPSVRELRLLEEIRQFGQDVIELNAIVFRNIEGRSVDQRSGMSLLEQWQDELLVLVTSIWKDVETWGSDEQKRLAQVGYHLLRQCPR